MDRCLMEKCLNWTGNGCYCELFDVRPITEQAEDGS